MMGKAQRSTVQPNMKSFTREQQGGVSGTAKVHVSTAHCWPALRQPAQCVHNSHEKECALQSLSMRTANPSTAQRYMNYWHVMQQRHSFDRPCTSLRHLPVSKQQGDTGETRSSPQFENQALSSSRNTWQLPEPDASTGNMLDDPARSPYTHAAVLPPFLSHWMHTHTGRLKQQVHTN